MIRQSRTEFYICVRLRETDTLEVRLPKGTGAYKWAKAINALREAIAEYGPAYKCVMEPVEYEVHG